MIRVDSGIELYDGPLPADTKLTFKIDGTNANTRAAHGPRNSSTNDTTGENRKLVSFSDLTPAQLEAEERAITDARRSRQNTTSRDRRSHHVEDLSEHLSQMHDASAGSARIVEHFQDEDLAAVLELSRREVCSREVQMKELEDQRALSEALKLSQTDPDRVREREEANDVRRAIEESANYSNEAGCRRREEEEEIGRILAMSRIDVNKPNDSYEEMVQKAIEESERIHKENFAKEEEENRMLLEALGYI